MLPLSPFVPLELLPFSTLELAVITANPPLFLLEWTRFVTLTPKIFQCVPPLLPWDCPIIVPLADPPLELSIRFVQ
jgi:hypothetical protein